MLSFYFARLLVMVIVRVYYAFLFIFYYIIIIVMLVMLLSFIHVVAFLTIASNYGTSLFSYGTSFQLSAKQ